MCCKISQLEEECGWEKRGNKIGHELVEIG